MMSRALGLNKPEPFSSSNFTNLSVEGSTFKRKVLSMITEVEVRLVFRVMSEADFGAGLGASFVEIGRERIFEMPMSNSVKRGVVHSLAAEQLRVSRVAGVLGEVLKLLFSKLQDMLRCVK